MSVCSNLDHHCKVYAVINRYVVTLHIDQAFVVISAVSAVVKVTDEYR